MSTYTRAFTWMTTKVQMNKIEWHTLVSIPSQLLEESHQIYKLLQENKWTNELNERKLNICSMYMEHVWELVVALIHKHYEQHGTKDIS